MYPATYASELDQCSGLQRETRSIYCFMPVHLLRKPFIGGVNLTMIIPHEQLATIARKYLIKWEELTPSLGLTRQDEVNIRATYRDYADQKCEALYTWKCNKGDGATYDAFIAAAEGISNMELADGVRDVMKELQGMYACICIDCIKGTETKLEHRHSNCRVP